MANTFILSRSVYAYEPGLDVGCHLHRQRIPSFERSCFAPESHQSEDLLIGTPEVV
jgi:hypothetical protein